MHFNSPIKIYNPAKFSLTSAHLIATSKMEEICGVLGFCAAQFLQFFDKNDYLNKHSVQ
jgi:hypothetical protein